MLYSSKNLRVLKLKHIFQLQTKFAELYNQSRCHLSVMAEYIVLNDSANLTNHDSVLSDNPATQPLFSLSALPL